LCITDLNAYRKLGIFQHHYEKEEDISPLHEFPWFILREGALKRKSELTLSLTAVPPGFMQLLRL
jgi:hypothetical protein